MGILQSIEGEGFALSHSIDIAPRDTDFPSHIHDCYELFCLVKGRVDYVVEGRLYKLRSGAIMLMRSSETHKLVVNKSSEYERYVLNFTPSLLLNAGFSAELLAPYRKRGLGEKNLYLPEEFEYAQPVSYLEKMIFEGECINNRDAILSGLASLLCAISVAFNKKQEQAREVAPVEKEIISFVNENLINDITIEKIADHVHISPSQVSRIFKSATGTSPHNYIITKRLIMFNKKISKGKGAIEACYECGFRDYSAFYRLYKKRFGKAPSKKQSSITQQEL